MSTRCLSLAVLLCSSGLISHAHANAPWTIIDSFSLPLTANANERLQTEYFRLNQWNVIASLSNQFHEAYFYPTIENRYPEGVHVMDAHKIGLGDFNGDGRQDVMISWATFPHTVLKPPIAPTVLLNESGRLALSSSIWAAQPPETMFAYKAGVADFNQDGRDDAVLASMGVVKRLADGKYENTWERIPLMVSQGSKLADFSGMIAGQETAVLNGFTFGHDMAVGDVNGDGFIDFYQGRHLFVGDGTGRFVPRNDLIPPEAGPNLHYVMSSAIGDLDNDGVDDLVIGVADGQPAQTAISGWIFLSNGQRNLASARKVPLPNGRFGLLNTKHNSMTLADLDGDGRLDIIIGQTAAQPYYKGRQLQVLRNQGGGIFVDETDLRVAATSRPDAQGEGTVRAMDINGDGYLDLVDSSGAKPEDVAILVNNGKGIFKRMPMSLLPIVQNYHLAGKEGWEGQSFGVARTGYIYPIDLDGSGVASFLVQMFMNADRWPLQRGDTNRSVLYTISARKPYEPVAGPRYSSDVECLFNWAEKIQPGVLPDKGVKTQRASGVDYRHYPGTNTYLGVRGNRVLLFQPAVSPELGNLGGIYQYLPLARSAGC
jgi:hypothetical protein